MAATMEVPDVLVRVDLESVADGRDFLKEIGASRRKRVLVCGSRYFVNARIVEQVLRQHVKPGQVVIEGEARGADTLAADAAAAMGCVVLGFPAPWAGPHGRYAGKVRNAVMLAMRPQLVIAFTDDVQASRGTRHTMKGAWELGLPIVLADSQGATQRFERQGPPTLSFEQLPVSY